MAEKTITDRLIIQLSEGLRAEADEWDYEPSGFWITWDDDSGCWMQNRRAPYGSMGVPLAEADPDLNEALFDRIAS